MMGTKENTSCVRNNVVVPFRAVQCVYSAGAPVTELIPHEHTAVRQYEQSAWDPIGTLLWWKTNKINIGPTQKHILPMF